MSRPAWQYELTHLNHSQLIHGKDMRPPATCHHLVCPPAFNPKEEKSPSLVWIFSSFINWPFLILNRKIQLLLKKNGKWQKLKLLQ